MSLKGSENIEKILNNIVNDLKSSLGNNIKSIIIFGPISRLEDFILGLSDINMVVIVKEKPSIKKRYNVISRYARYRLNILFLDVKNLIDILKSGYPIGYWLVYDSKILYDDSTFRMIIEKIRPIINEYTKESLFKLSLVALSLAAENYFSGFFLEAINYLYYSLKHAIEWACLIKFNLIPTSNRQIKEFLAKMSYPIMVRLCFNKLISLRKRGEVSQFSFRTLANSVIKSLCNIFNIRASDWVYIEMKIRDLLRESSLSKIRVSIDKGKLIWEVYIATLNRIKVEKIS